MHAQVAHLLSTFQPSSSSFPLDPTQPRRTTGFRWSLYAVAMPPLPPNGSSYPPSSSGYQRLNLDDDDDLESHQHPPSSSHLTQRTFTTSPYRSLANDPTQLLQTFLSDTRPPTAQPKELSLRISVRFPNTSATKHVELPLPALTTHDALPFALADDVPCLRGLPVTGARTWTARLRSLLAELTHGSAPSTARARLNLDTSTALQVWNASRSNPLYASEDEVARHRKRIDTTTLPPWTPLTDEFLAPPASTPAGGGGAGIEEQVDKLFDASGGLADFNMSAVFRRTRQRKTSRLVPSGLQEAIERFADDRHFSKHLVASECVWGWNMALLKKRIAEMVADAAPEGKGKSREHTADDVQIDVKVVGLDSARVYHVVWAPITYLSRSRYRALFDSRAALLGLVGLTALLLGSTLLGMLTNTLVIIVAVLTVAAWSALTWLIRTQDACVYDSIGTAWPLAPRWVKLADADPAWDRDAVVQSLGGAEDKEWKIESRGAEGWFVQRGMEQDEWLDIHRERLVHALRA